MHGRINDKRPRACLRNSGNRRAVRMCASEYRLRGIACKGQRRDRRSDVIHKPEARTVRERDGGRIREARRAIVDANAALVHDRATGAKHRHIAGVSVLRIVQVEPGWTNLKFSRSRNRAS